MVWGVGVGVLYFGYWPEFSHSDIRWVSQNAIHTVHHYFVTTYIWAQTFCSLVTSNHIVHLALIVHREDVDDKYDKADFVLQRCFRGNFTLGNYTLTQDAQSDSLFILKKVSYKKVLFNIVFSSVLLKNK